MQGYCKPGRTRLGNKRPKSLQALAKLASGFCMREILPARSSLQLLARTFSLMTAQILIGLYYPLHVQGIVIFRIVNPLKLTTSQSQLLSSTDRHPNFDGRAALFHT